MGKRDSGIIEEGGIRITLRLAERYRQVEAAECNQEAADQAHILTWLRPQIAEKVLSGLRLRQGRRLISVIVADMNEKLKKWTRYLETKTVAAIPLVVYRDGFVLQQH